MSFFYLSLKHATIDLGFEDFSDAVKHAAILNCVSNEWCSFMCLLCFMFVFYVFFSP